MDRHELADDVAVADHDARRLAAELQVLRHQPDRGHREDLVAVADLGAPVDHARRADPAVACRSARARRSSRTGRRPSRRRSRRRDGRSRSGGCRRARALGSARTRPGPSRARPRPRSPRRSAPAHAPGQSRSRRRRASPRAAADRRARPASGTSRCPRRAARCGAIVPLSGPCMSRMVATCASVSIISTAGISGAPGNAPGR